MKLDLVETRERQTDSQRAVGVRLSKREREPQDKRAALTNTMGRQDKLCVYVEDVCIRNNENVCGSFCEWE